jgi:hypothetical protein
VDDSNADSNSNSNSNGLCRRGSETAQTLTGALAPWLAPIADPQCKFAGQRWVLWRPAARMAAGHSKTRNIALTCRNYVALVQASVGGDTAM